MKCDYCGAETDWFCMQCDEPVCEECATPFTMFNQQTETQCPSCLENDESERIAHFIKNEEIEAKAEATRSHRNKLARMRYHSPEQKEKRRKAKTERDKEKREMYQKAFSEVMKIAKANLK